MGSSFKFLHAADVHLDSPLRGLERYEGAPVARLRGATRRAFENLARLAIKEEVAFLVLAGDLYDGDWKDYNTGLFFTRVMRDLREAGIPVYVLAGNHDAASQITRSLQPPDNVHVFSTDRPQTFALPELGVALHGQGFATRSVTENLALAYPDGKSDRFDVGVLHTSLDGREGHAPYAPCSLADLRAKGYDYWALGHVHQREEVSRDPWVVFPGNPQGRHAKETGEKGAMLVTVTDHEVNEVAFRPLDVLRWACREVDLGGVDQIEAVLPLVREAIEAELEAHEGHLVALRLLLTGSTSVHAALHAARDDLIARCRSQALDAGGEDLWLEKVALRTRPAVDLSAARDRDDALGGLLRGIDALEGDESFADALNAVWGELRGKLPGEVRTEILEDDEPASHERILAEVKDLLLARLAEREIGT